MAATHHERVSFSNKARRDYLWRSWLTLARFWSLAKTVPVDSARLELSDGKGFHTPLTGCGRQLIRLQKAETAQLPDIRLPRRRIPPEQVWCTVTTEVSYANDLPVRIRDGVEVVAGLEARAVHLPDGILARGTVTPNKVSNAIVVQISRTHHLPVRIANRVDVVAGLQTCTVQPPDGVLARRPVAPQEVGDTVRVEVSGTDNLPVGIRNWVEVGPAGAFEQKPTVLVGDVTS